MLRRKWWVPLSAQSACVRPDPAMRSHRRRRPPPMPHTAPPPPSYCQPNVAPPSAPVIRSQCPTLFCRPQQCLHCRHRPHPTFHVRRSLPTAFSVSADTTTRMSHTPQLVIAIRKLFHIVVTFSDISRSAVEKVALQNGSQESVSHTRTQTPEITLECFHVLTDTRETFSLYIGASSRTD